MKKVEKTQWKHNSLDIPILIINITLKHTIQKGKKLKTKNTVIVFAILF